jgi:protein-S-isoprenylcysteine O-methyltransferase Ste14
MSMWLVSANRVQYYASFNQQDALFMPENMSENDSYPREEPPPSDSRGGWWVVGQVLLFILFILSVLDSGPVPDVPGIDIARIVGVVVALCGAGVSVWAFSYHGSRLTPFPKPVAGQELIASGPYRYVRHPMYFGIILFTLGVGLAYANPVTILSSLAFTVFFMAKTDHEERLLVQDVPGYRQYRSAVPWRLIPFVL